MAFDSMVLASVAHELQTELIGTKINKIHQPDPHTLLLRYHGPEGRGRLLISAHPQNGRLHKTETLRENPAKAPLFAMVLRKWLEGARITGISATDGERVAKIEIAGRDELGDTVHLRLIVEIMGKHSNIILVHENGLIIDGIRRYGSSLSRYREVLPGREYKAPPPLSRLALPPKDEEELAAALYEEAENSVSETLQRRISGLSPLLATHVCLCAGVLPQNSGEHLGAGQIGQLYQALVNLRTTLTKGSFTPTLRRKEGRYQDFSAIAPLSWPAEEQIACASMNEAVEGLYAEKEEEQRFQSRKTALEKQIRQHVNRLSKKIFLQEADLFRCEEADFYKEAGDLLSANLWQLQKGWDEVELPSFTRQGAMVTIPLEPALSPQENVQRYYRRYAKAKHARIQIEIHLTANREELAYAQSIEEALNQSEGMEELNEPEREGIAAGYLRPQSVPGKQQEKIKRPVALPPRSYQSSDGFTVLIGRNNKQNDRLSLKQASADDLWLHTQKIAGSHVIILSEGKTVPERTILEAASWAAWFSKAKDSAHVPVDYLPAGKLKKPPGARPGYVIFSGQKTCYVQPLPPPGEENTTQPSKGAKR